MASGLIRDKAISSIRSGGDFIVLHTCVLACLLRSDYRLVNFYFGRMPRLPPKIISAAS